MLNGEIYNYRELRSELLAQRAAHGQRVLPLQVAGEEKGGPEDEPGAARDVDGGELQGAVGGHEGPELARHPARPNPAPGKASCRSGR